MLPSLTMQPDPAKPQLGGQVTHRPLFVTSGYRPAKLIRRRLELWREDFDGQVHLIGHGATLSSARLLFIALTALYPGTPREQSDDYN